VTGVGLRQVLVADDDLVDQMAFARLVRSAALPIQCTWADSVAEAKEALGAGNFDAAVLDYWLGDGSALDLLPDLRTVPTLIVAGTSDPGIAAEVRQAGAVDFLGKRYGLPDAASGHNNYWLWGPSGSGEVVIVISRQLGDLPDAFEEVSQEGFIHDDTGYVQPSENDLSVFVVRKPRKPIGLLWRQTKHYE